jgi:sulfotransferase
MQNPRFYATHTSGLVNLLFLVRNQWHKIVEHQAHPNNDALLNVLRGTLNSYYQHIDKPVIFDKNRAWMQYFSFIENILGKKVKMLVCLRSIPEILASIERIHRKTAAIRQPPGEEEFFMQMQTLQGRCEVWMNMNSFLGLAYARLIDSVNSEYRDRMFFINFDEFTSSPRDVMERMYDFLGEDYFEHNFNNVEQVTVEDDTMYGFENLHVVRPKIEYTQPYARSLLGDELYFKFKQFDLNF